MTSVIDMHIHTTRGASDSSLRPVELARAARRLGLSAVVVTEHDRLWDPLEVARFREERSLLLINGMEVSTDLGHVLVLGVHAYLPAMRFAGGLRRIVSDAGGYMIAAHPFRHQFNRVEWERQGLEPRDLTPEEASRLPLLNLVDAIEVLNGGNSLEENVLALEVADVLGKPGVPARTRTPTRASASIRPFSSERWNRKPTSCASCMPAASTPPTASCRATCSPSPCPRTSSPYRFGRSDR